MFTMLKNKNQKMVVGNLYKSSDFFWDRRFCQATRNADGKLTPDHTVICGNSYNCDITDDSVLMFIEQSRSDFYFLFGDSLVMGWITGRPDFSEYDEKGY